MLMQEQPLLQGSRNTWHSYATGKRLFCSYNHWLQYFMKATTLLQPTKFLKIDIIQQYSIWGTARKLKYLEFRVCRIAMDCYFLLHQCFSVSFITFFTQHRITSISRINILIILGTIRHCTFRRKILLRFCYLDCVRCFQCLKWDISRKH